MGLSRKGFLASKQGGSTTPRCTTRTFLLALGGLLLLLLLVRRILMQEQDLVPGFNAVEALSSSSSTSVPSSFISSVIPSAGTSPEVLVLFILTRYDARPDPLPTDSIPLVVAAARRAMPNADIRLLTNDDAVLLFGNRESIPTVHTREFATPRADFIMKSYVRSSPMHFEFERNHVWRWALYADFVRAYVAAGHTLSAIAALDADIFLLRDISSLLPISTVALGDNDPPLRSYEMVVSTPGAVVLFTPAGLQGFADFLVALYANSTYYLPLIGSVFSEMLNGERYIGDMHIMIYFAGLSPSFRLAFSQPASCLLLQNAETLKGVSVVYREGSLWTVPKNEPLCLVHFQGRAKSLIPAFTQFWNSSDTGTVQGGTRTFTFEPL